jgi:hypothetical protein
LGDAVGSLMLDMASSMKGVSRDVDTAFQLAEILY